MIKLRPSLVLAIATSIVIVAAVPVVAAAKKPRAEEAALPAGRVVEYAELEHLVGADIEIETNLKTIRRGTLVKYTNPALTIKLGPEHGSILFTAPQPTIRRISVFAEPPAPAPAQGTGSAKTN